MDKHVLDTLIGTLLGDGCLRKDKNGINARYQFKQKGGNGEYVQHLNDLLFPLSRGVRHTVQKNPKRIGVKISNALEHWDGTYKSAAYFWTSVDECLTRLWREWYSGGVKRVPPTLDLNWRKIAYWYMDDGNNNQNRANITLHTNSFTLGEVRFLIGRLGTLGIKAHPQKKGNKHVIYVGKESYHHFIDMVRPFVTFDCFSHKVDTSEVKETREGWGRHKLTMEHARTIRRLYFSDNYTQSQLAHMFGVTQTMIGRIVNNKAHIDHAVGFGGECEVRVNYNL